MSDVPAPEPASSAPPPAAPAAAAPTPAAPAPAAPKPAPPAAAAPFDDSDTFEHMWARTSTRIGLIAMGLCIAGPVTCFLSYWLAGPLGAVGLWLGRNAYMAAAPDSATRAYSKVGMIAGGTALACALVYFIVATTITLFWSFLFILADM